MKSRIYKRRDGKFEGRLKVGRTAQGKTQFKYAYGYTLEECKAKLAELCARTEAAPKNPMYMTYEDVCGEWMDFIRTYAKESTAAVYAYTLRRYLLPHFGRYNPAEISEGRVNRYIAELAKQKTHFRHGRFSAVTVANIAVIFKMTLAFAHRHLSLPIPLCRLRLPSARKESSRLPDGDWQKLRRIILADSSKTAAVIALAACMGMRIGEICALRRSDIDFQNGILSVRRTVQRIYTAEPQHRTKLLVGPPKSSKSYRLLPMPAIVSIKLRRQCRGRYGDDFIFGTEKNRPLDPRTVQYRFKKYLAAHGIAYVNFHQLRHKFAGSCVENNFDLKALSEILGHSSISTTLNYYVHPTLEFKRSQMDMMSARDERAD